MSLSLTLVSHIPYFYLFQGHLSTLKEHLLTIINRVSFCMRYVLEYECEKHRAPDLSDWGGHFVIQCNAYLERNVLTCHTRHTPISTSYASYILAEIKVSCRLCPVPSPILVAPIQPPLLHLHSEYAITFVIILVWWSLNLHSSIPCLRFHFWFLYCY